MNLKENGVLADIIDDCEETRPYPSKNWLNSATSSLAKLDSVKPNVYNVGLINHKDLKATNLAIKTLRNTNSLSEVSTIAPSGFQKLAWGSNPSIPDLLKQQNGKVPSRPVSAKVARKSRPPSAGKLRPQSAKNPSVPPSQPTDKFSIHGSKFDPSDRPPSGFHHNSTAGWVGAPPVFKYTHSSENIKDLCSNVVIDTRQSPPPPPAGTPDINAEFLHDENYGTDKVSDLEDEQLKNSAPAGPVVLKPIHFSLPIEDIDNDNEDDDPDTARLLEEVEKHTSKKKNVFHVDGEKYSNSSIPQDDSRNTNYNEKEQTNSAELLPEKSATDKLQRSESHSNNANENNNTLTETTPERRRQKSSAGESRRPLSGKLDLRHVQSRVNSGLRRPVADSRKPKTSVDQNEHNSFNVFISPEAQKNLTTSNSNKREIAKVTVAYEEESYKKESIKDSKPTQKFKTKSSQKVQSLFSQLTLSDEELDFVSDNEGSDNEFDKFDTSSKEFRPSSTTKLISNPEKNYYEMSRHSNKEVNKGESEDFLIKTVKTIEFDREEPKETVEYSRIDVAQKVRSTSPIERPKSGLRSRPPSSKKQVKKLHFATYQPDEERPGSRIGFVAMAPDEKAKKKSQRNHVKNATENESGSTQKVIKERKFRTKKFDDVATLINQGVDVSSSTDRQNSVGNEDLLESSLHENTSDAKTHDDVDTLVSQGGSSSYENETSSSLHKSRPHSAKPVSSKCHCSVNRPLSAKRPISASEAKRSNVAIQIMRGEKMSEKAIANELKKRVLETKKHYAMHARSSSPDKADKPKTYDTSNAFIINTKKPQPYIETEEVLKCRETQQVLDENGIDVDIETLERALFPPRGDSTYYEVTANLPKSATSGLLSHPKYWIPEEYKKFKQAEKKLAKAEEIMWLQKKAEERRARIAEGKTGSKKKTKGKKKLISKLKKSHSLG